ncbi:MAG: COX15/CtaA family protein [Deltaproteobacteria bacterium]|nr:COX15/CtaA family protein [Deltaproteobacteria bacterium]
MSEKNYSRLILLTTFLTFIVVILGAYVRLSNAGLGCPDWPGCYGHLAAPHPDHVNQHFPEVSYEAHKAWKEMIHRYLAGALGLCILLIAIFSIKQKNASKWLPWFLVGLVLFQAALGRWTVTLKLHPFVVMSHLLGGLLTLVSLVLLSLQQKSFLYSPLRFPKPLLWIGLFLLVLQIILGGWMSSNYASLACPDLPTCQGYWVPPLDFKNGFFLFHDFGTNYEGGVLGNHARMTIHFLHRVGSILVFLFLGATASILMKRSRGSSIHTFARLLLWVLILQMGLGISNILFHLPLGVAVAHNGGAAILLSTLVSLIYLLHKISSDSSLAASEKGC